MCISVGIVSSDIFFDTSLSRFISNDIFWIGWSLIVIAMFFIKIIAIYLTELIETQKKYFKKTLKYTENIDEILLKLKDIHTLVKKIIVIIGFFRFTIKDSERQEIYQYLAERAVFILAFSINLRSDLQVRLMEQQKILESAKSKVSKHITWTTELDHVSGLQRVRLDKQIEQFEELQRVLVKV